MNPVAALMVMVEYMVATGLFAFGFERRKRFWVRLPLSCIGALGVATLLVFFLPQGQIFTFINFFSQFILCAAIVYICFNVSIVEAMSSGAAGVATQHFAYNLYVLISLGFSYSAWLGRDYRFLAMILEDLTVKAPIYALFYFVFAKKMKGERIQGQSRIVVSLVSIMIVLVCVGVMRFVRGTNRETNTIVAESLYAMVCCVAALGMLVAINANNKLKQKETTLRALFFEKSHEYETKMENAELLKIHLHDLRHHVQNLQSIVPEGELASLKDSIAAYEPPFKTGNPVLDVVLLGINNSCLKKRISLTYIGDGNILSFLEEVELFSLFENACDNAIDAVSELDEESRHISISVKSAGDLAIVNVINFFKGDLSFKGNLPMTTKLEDRSMHGYGMLSMKIIAEKYQGGVNIVTDNNVFSLTVYMQNPKKKR